MEENNLNKITALIILVSILVLSFFLLKPVLLSIIVGFILAFIFFPIYNKIYSLTKMKNVSAMIVSVVLILLIILPIWFLTPIILNQSIKFFVSSQQIDFVLILKKIFPSIFASQEFSAQIGSVISSSVAKTTNSLMNAFANFILNFPIFILQLLVVSFTFFFSLRDKEQLITYVKSLLPFSKDVEKKLFDYSKEITFSVIYGQVIIGILQGMITGAGFFIFRVPNALLFTSFAVVASIIPMLGPVFIWVPIVIYLILAGNTSAAVGVTIFGLIASTVDNFLRPIIISRRTRVPPSIIVVGMVGGIFLFGVLGLILGPLILSYLLIILELYRKKEAPKIFMQENTKS